MRGSLVGLMVVLLPLAGWGQGAKKMAPVAEASVVDTALIRQTGADAYGMKSYVFVLLKKGANADTSKALRDKAFEGHFANMGRLAKEGKLMLAGPFGKNEKDWSGLFIFNVKREEEAKALVETDPAIVGGYLSYELCRWYGSAAVMLVPEQHKKLQVKQF